MPITKELFGTLPNGTKIDRYILKNNNGMEVQISNYGATVTSIKTPNKEGLFEQVILGFDTLEGYLQEQPFLGCVVGRYANRIAKGQFSINGTSYQLATNDAPNHLHGGIHNFSKVVWAAESTSTKRSTSLHLKYFSINGEEGFPGNLACEIVYTLTDNDALQIDYSATTDQATVVNLTNHCYFNLKDGGKSPVLDHELRLFANYFTPVDKTCIPLGTLQSVKKTPFDFSNWKKLGEQISTKDKQIQIGNGYDHNFVINESNHDLTIAAKLYDRHSGRVMTVHTTKPGIQLYTANWLDGTLKGHQGISYSRRCAVCLETQYFPDSPNQPTFPSALLLPEETYKTQTVYQFSVKK